MGLGDGFKLELGDCDRDNDGKKEGRNVAVEVGPTVWNSDGFVDGIKDGISVGDSVSF